MSIETLKINEHYIGEFGDTRLLKKGIMLFKKMCEGITMNIRKLAGTRAAEVGIHRFLDNDNVTQEEIEASIAEKTIRNIGQLKEILVINDTSEVSYPSQKQKKDSFGGTGNKYGKGFFIHPNIIVNPQDSSILGMAGIEIWQRTESNTKKTKGKKPIEKKESYKWIQAIEKVLKYLAHIPKKTFITDRESDIYEYMNRVIRQGDNFIVRATHNRKLQEEEGYMAEFIKNTEIAYSYEFALEETPKGKKRIAKLHLKHGKLTLLRSKSILNKDNYDERMTVNFVDVEEDLSTSPNENLRIRWRLLTSHEVNSIVDAIRIVAWYKLRWTVEPIFGGSKKRGLNIEECQISSFEKLKKLATVGINSVIHVFHLIKARDGENNLPAKNIFSEEQVVFLSALLKTLEGKTQKQKNPFSPGTMAWGAWIIARLGGWKGYASERPPGYGTMHDGLQKFYNMFQGWQICHA